MTPAKTELLVFSAYAGRVTHLSLNGLLCDTDPTDDTLFSSALVGTSTATLKEEYASFVACNQDPSNPYNYCLICLYRLDKKLA